MHYFQVRHTEIVS